jgi:tRNA threonylcarbamoyladenosine biosynthesis protein TsaB
MSRCNGGSLLALDATGEWCSVAWTDGRRSVARAVHAGQRHSELLLAMVGEVLQEAGVALSGLEEIAFGAGPGSFTGLRIACGVAQGLALGAVLPLRPVSSLLALAQAQGAAAVLAAIDARMGEVYWAAYRLGGNGMWQCVQAPRVGPPEAIEIPPGGGWSGVGSAFVAYPQLGPALRGLEAIDGTVQVSARAIAQLARAGHGTLDAPERAAPVYIRDRVALTTAERVAVRP